MPGAIVIQASVRQKPEECASGDALPCGLCSLAPLCFPDGAAASEPAGPARRRSLATGQHLLYAGQVCRSLQVLRSGSVKGYTLSKAGSERTTDIYLRGEPIGLDAFGQSRQREYLVALEPSSYCEIPLPVVRRLMTEHWPVREAVMALLGGALAAARERMPALRQGPARARLAAFLVDLHERRRQRELPGERFRLSLDRSEIASLLGLTLETVSRSMSNLQRDGLIRVSGKHLSLLQPEALAREAEGVVDD